MSYSGITVYVDATTIANEMLQDADITYDILDKIAGELADDGFSGRFLERLCENIYEDENTTLLDLFQTIISNFSHLKETND